MKKLLIGVALLTGCGTSTTTATTTAVTPSRAPAPSSGTSTGAGSPREAVAGFLAAVKDGDLQALAAVWGNKDGPARDRFDRVELEQRELIMVRCLRHDSYTILDETPSIEGDRALSVQLKRKDLTGTTAFIVTLGPARRWYMKSVDLDLVKAFCG